MSLFERKIVLFGPSPGLYYIHEPKITNKYCKIKVENIKRLYYLAFKSIAIIMDKYFKLTSESKVNYLGFKLFRVELTIDCKWGKAGTKGGWVDKEEVLQNKGWVEDESEAFNNSRVYNSRVYYNSSVYNSSVYNSSVYYNSRVYNSRVYNSRVYYNSSVDNSRVYNSSVYKQQDYISFTNVGSRYSTVTFYKHKDGGVWVWCGCFKGSLKKFIEAVKERHSDNQFGKEYMAIVEVVKLRFGL